MLKIDLHIHTILSGHAFGTFYDIVKEAKKKEMTMIAITDHGPAIPNGSQKEVFTGTHKRMPKIEGIKVLFGCETNLITKEGNLDIQEKHLKDLDIVLFGFHSSAEAYKDLGKEENTKAIIKALNKNRIHIFVHPNANHFYNYDTEKVMEVAIKNNILLEINISYIIKMASEKGIESFKQIVDITRKHKKKLIVNTDSHFLHEIGDDSILEKVKDKIGLTDDLIINNYPEELIKFIQSK
jgi:putative hydrolase